MTESNPILWAAISCALLTSPAYAQETNVVLLAPATRLESFETNIGVVILKATSEIGSVSANTGVVSVKSREITDTSSGRQERGIVVEINQRGQFKDRLLIDYDELGPLLKGLDYLTKLDTSVTTLNTFDATFTTRGGLHIAALGDRRTGSIQFGVRDSRLSTPPVVFSRDDMNRFCSLIEQAKKQLGSLGQKQ